MQEETFQLNSEWIALCDLLKACGFAQSGGQAKAWIADALVMVDGQIETRKTCKIRAGQMVECKELSFKIKVL